MAVATVARVLARMLARIVSGMVDMLWVEYKMAKQILEVSKRRSFGLALKDSRGGRGDRGGECHQLLCGLASKPDAIGDADAIVRVSGEAQAG